MTSTQSATAPVLDEPVKAGDAGKKVVELGAEAAVLKVPSDAEKTQVFAVIAAALVAEGLEQDVSDEEKSKVFEMCSEHFSSVGFKAPPAEEMAKVFELAAAAAPPAEEKAKVAELFTKLAAEGDRLAAATELAAFVKGKGLTSLRVFGILEKIQALSADAAKDGYAREGAMLAYKALVESMGAPMEPYLMSEINTMLAGVADKKKEVQAAAAAALEPLVAGLRHQSVTLAVPVLLASVASKHKWQTKELAIKMIASMAKNDPKNTIVCMSELVDTLSIALHDLKKEVKGAAMEAMQLCCDAVGNRDIEKFIPALISCILRPVEVPETVHLLSSTTFVQTVEMPALALMCPLLVRGLKDPKTAIKRKAAVIVENMSKLVDNPNDAAPFLPRLAPELEKNADEVADPECRDTTGRALKTLKRVAGEGKEAELAKEVNHDLVFATLRGIISKTSSTPLVVDGFVQVLLKHIVSLVAQLIYVRKYEIADWKNCCVPYLSALVPEADAEAITTAFMDACFIEAQEDMKVEEDEEPGEDLCKCEFSLAYGGMILLNNTKLHLKKGKRYGLCGPNGCGKSTLMRAIANEQLDGFPTKAEVRTVYVEHDIDGSEADTPVLDFIVEDEMMKEVGASREDILKELEEVGFDEEMRAKPICALSGGWKMKLALARAMLYHADILLLDEPTNHLDVNNVEWLENFLLRQERVTSMIVSHDSGFLDNVCSNIIHYEYLKLVTYRGNLKEFVRQKPEAQSYYDLEATLQETWNFPDPGVLPGVKSRDRAILKMSGVRFRYPGAPRDQLQGIGIQLSMASRVAVVGKNGAGKSTMIKLLVGELEPSEGKVEKHSNMRVAYVAQHALVHVNEHLDMTPNEYIQWRFAPGEDREMIGTNDRKITEEDLIQMNKDIKIHGEKRKIKKLLARRKAKRGYEYEVMWQNRPEDDTMWLPRDDLTDYGFDKLVNDYDAREAQRAGLASRPLTKAGIEKHLGNFGLPAEFATHNRIRGLSGGQKVKVVLAAAMWNCPHVVILDEPTNFLDRDSLGSLAAGIKEYLGGVVIISHNQEFTKNLCSETWMMVDGKLTASGSSWVDAAKNDWGKKDKKQDEDVVDALGNVVKVKEEKKKLSRKEQKAKEKRRKMRIEAGLPVSDDDDSD